MALTKEFFLKTIADLQTNMTTNVDTKLNAIREDMNIRDSAFQTRIIEINNQSAIELKASLDEALFDAAEVNADNLRTAIEGVESKMDDIVKDVAKLKINGNGKPDPWHTYARADESAPSKARRVGEPHEHRRSSDLPENVLDEAFTKAQCKVKVDGFLGNATNDYRVQSLTTFLGTLEHYTGKGEIKAYGKTDSMAYIVFETPQQAKDFLKTNGKEFGSFKPEGVNGTDRKMKFSGWISKKDMKKKSATNVFGNILKQKFKFEEEHNFHWDNIRCCVKVKDFQVVAISMDEEMNVKFHSKIRNINDCGVALLKEAIDEAIVEFHKAWVP